MYTYLLYSKAEPWQIPISGIAKRHSFSNVNSISTTEPPDGRERATLLLPRVTPCICGALWAAPMEDLVNLLGGRRMQQVTRL